MRRIGRLDEELDLQQTEEQDGSVFEQPSLSNSFLSKFNQDNVQVEETRVPASKQSLVQDLTKPSPDFMKEQEVEAPKIEETPEAKPEDELTTAQNLAAENMRQARTQMAANQILQGGTQFAGGQFDPNTPFVKNLVETADRPVSNLLEKRKQEVQQFDFNNKQKLNDPNSAESQQARDLIAKNFPEFASSPSFAKMTAQQLDDNFKVLQLREQLEARRDIARQSAAERALRQQELAASRAAEEDRKGRQYATERTAKFQDGVNKSLEKVNEQITKGEQIDVIAEKAKTNPMSAAQLGVQVAKAMGEVGALSEADVTRYVANKALVPRVTQVLNSLAKGTITEQNADLLKESIKALTDMAKDRRNVIIRSRARQFSRNMSESLGKPYSVNDTLILLGQDDLADFEDPTLESVQTIEQARKEAMARAEQRKENSKAASKGVAKFRQKQADGKVALFDENKKFIGFEE